MSTVDLSRFSFSGGENAAPIDDLTRLPAEDRERLVLAGIDVNDRQVSGAFMQLNHAGVHCETRRDGLELMDIRAALKKFDGLPRYYWQLLDPDKDDFTRMAREHLNGGYFVRARKGAKISEPVQSCMFIKGHGAGQSTATSWWGWEAGICTFWAAAPRPPRRGSPPTWALRNIMWKKAAS